MGIDLTNYTGISRKGKVIKFENRLNKYPFSTEEVAKKFERLYNFLAVEALKEVRDIIKKRSIIHDAEKLTEKALTFYAKEYYMKGITGISTPTLGGIEKKAYELLALSKDLKLLKRVGLI